MRCDAHKDVSEVADDIDFGNATAFDEGVGDGSGAATARAAGEEPIASPDGDRAYGSLAGIMPRPRLCRVMASMCGHVRAQCDGVPTNAA